MLRAYKYRIYPNADQKAKIDHTIDICRFIYNAAKFNTHTPKSQLLLGINHHSSDKN